MVQQADVVVTYVKSPAGGAAQFQAMALRLHKRVINLAETVQP
jgi:ribosomal protein S10